MQIYIESLGCARNQVDSETMAGQLRLAGWHLTEDPAEAEVIVVNTCSFVESAINESIDTILELARFKEDGHCRQLIVAGCLPERFRDAIADSLPEVDQFLGTGAFGRIVDAVEDTLPRGACLLPDPDLIPIHSAATRQRQQTHTAYLKIAEGCSRHCTYCIIPRLRGQQKSRPMHLIIEEARQLIEAGVKEINLVAQDTTGYGHDLAEPATLADLLERLAGLEEQTWIRFLYGHPESITDGVIDTVAAHPNLCAYFDLPVQHAAESVLKKMGRHYDSKQLLDLFARIRSRVPGAAIRTTLIVGFPGETDADFKQLMDFVETVRFDHLGVFVYSDAEDLPSHALPGHVSKQTAQQRHDAIMARQLDISEDNLAALCGNALPVLIEHSPEPGLYEGRTMLQAPEVDGLTYVRQPPGAPELAIGQIVPVTIVETLEYDLIGEAK
ncbi:RimO: ribosomal protein S12 methylthiotransferase [Desulfosarcina variabilis str. Montpellier]|uniref:30S ribosomal protein S12 methylthiotransferase RimO n=1 Tax=Desulfosarcina variabilis TaxID=2300 RepID=UPI003AFB57D3